MMLREVLAGGARLAPEVVPYLVRVLGAARRIAERRVRDGTLRPVDPLFTHLSLIGSLLFFFAKAPFRERLAKATDAPLRAPPASDVSDTSKSSLRGAWQLTYGRRPPRRCMEPRHDVS